MSIINLSVQIMFISAVCTAISVYKEPVQSFHAILLRILTDFLTVDDEMESCYGGLLGGSGDDGLGLGLWGGTSAHGGNG